MQSAMTQLYYNYVKELLQKWHCVTCQGETYNASANVCIPNSKYAKKQQNIEKNQNPKNVHFLSVYKKLAKRKLPSIKNGVNPLRK